MIVASVVAAGAPFPAGLVRRPRPDSPQLWIMAWAAAGTITNAIAEVLRSHHLYNIFVSWYYTPIEMALLLWALSLWHSRPLFRTTLRAAILVMLAGWTIALVYIEKVGGGHVGFADAAYDITMLVAAVFTLSLRATDDAPPLIRDPALWICAGLALYHGVFAILSVLTITQVLDNPALVMRAIYVRAGFNVMAMTLVTVGMLLPPDPERARG
jgi:hypothetical protein